MAVMVLVAFALGFAGYLPLGNINTTVVQLRLTNKRQHWQGFILFAAFMEFVYCFGSLYGIEQLRQQSQLLHLLNWSAVFLFLLLGLLSFFHSHLSPEQTSTGLKKGILIAIFNPLQIPFWMVWGVYVMQNGWVNGSLTSILLFSTICTAGTVAVLYLYAEAGKWMIEKLNLNQQHLNRFIGVLFIALAVYQWVKLMR